MGKTSSTVKNRYNAKVYDPISVRVKKGKKAVYQEAAARQNESLNTYIIKAVEARISSENAN